MPKGVKKEPKPIERRLPPAITPEARESQLVSLAFDLVEQRLLDGTATSQETTAILRLGTTRAKLEREKLENEAKLAKAKADAIEAQKRTEEMMEKALVAFRRYSGHNEQDEDDEELL